MEKICDTVTNSLLSGSSELGYLIAFVFSRSRVMSLSRENNVFNRRLLFRDDRFSRDDEKQDVYQPRGTTRNGCSKLKSSSPHILFQLFPFVSYKNLFKENNVWIYLCISKAQI